MQIDDLLTKKPFVHSNNEKEPLFLDAMNESLAWHYEHSPLYRRWIDGERYRIKGITALEQIPALPVSLFREVELISVPRERIVSTVFSSSTTGNKPSTIFLDTVTIKRQQEALRHILADTLGTERRTFIVFDAPKTVRQGGMQTSSRSSAIRGMTQFASRMFFVLDENLKFDDDAWEEAVTALQKGGRACFFGFTWLLYQTADTVRSAEFKEIMKDLKEKDLDALVLHIGGWKKLKDAQIDKQAFNDILAPLFAVSGERVIDMYGMTEQLGTVYLDCSEGYKHVPLYSHVLIRDADTLERCDIGKSGFIELLTPIPHSYPGVALLTDDIGEVVGVDDCLCGRKGTYFIFKERAEAAPPKGCGDTL